MRRYTQLAACIALLAALSCRAFAALPAAPLVRLDPARMFNPASESLLSGLFIPPATLSPVARVLFGDPAPSQVAMVAAAASSAPSPSSVVGAVRLRPYAPQALRLPQLDVERAAAAPALVVTRPRLNTVALQPPSVHFGSYALYTPAQQSLRERVDVPVRVGPVHFTGTVSGDTSQTVHVDAVREMQLCGTTDEAAACPYLHDERVAHLSAATDFDVRAGATHLDLRLGGSISRLVNRDAGMYEYAPLDPDLQFDAPAAGSPSAQTPFDSSLLYYPGLTDLVRHGVNASVAVPISPALTVGLQYDRTHYAGNYAAILTPGFDARKDTYLGNVTYTLPNSSSLTLSARQYRFQDSSAPNFSLTQTRADLQFTVKF